MATHLYGDLPQSRNKELDNDSQTAAAWTDVAKPPAVPPTEVQEEEPKETVPVVEPPPRPMRLAPPSVLKKQSGVGTAPVTDVHAGQTQSARQSFRLFPDVENEYDPAKPNDYEAVIEERERKKLQAEMEAEKQERLRLEEAEQQVQREQDRREKRQNEGEVADIRQNRRKLSEIPTPDPGPTPQTGEGKGMPLAQKMLEKFGWRKGEGLGKERQGMATPLVAQKTDTRSAVIVNAQQIPQPEHSETHSLAVPPVQGKVTRVVLLRNLVGPGEVDDDLEEEVGVELQKYGRVQSVLIFEVTEEDFPAEEAVRIFVEFKTTEESRKAANALNGRYFGGRAVRAGFYSEARFQAQDLAPVAKDFPAMSAASSPGARLASIVDDKPIYVASHANAAVAVLKLVDYDAWVLSEEDCLVKFLHGVHLRLDELVQQYGFYKVDFHAGEFTVAANISAEATNAQVAETILEFATEAMSALKDVEFPRSRTGLRTQISLTTGALRSAILGKAALKYSVHGRAEVEARRLLKYYGRDGSIIASKEFVENLMSSASLFVGLKGEGAKDTVQAEWNVGAYLYTGNATHDAQCGDPTCGSQLAEGGWRMIRFLRALCFEDADKEHRFRMFQADRFSSFDVLYMSLSLSMTIASLLRASRTDSSTVSITHFILSSIGTALPLLLLVRSGRFYRENRHLILVFFRVLKLATLAVFGFRRSMTDLTPLVLNYAIVQGMHAIGTQMVLPVHLAFQVFCFVVILLKSMIVCQLNPAVRGCHPAVSGLILFIFTFLVPSCVAFRVEKHQRCLYSHGSSSGRVKQD